MMTERSSLTFELVVQILQNDPDDLHQRENQSAERQRAHVIPDTDSIFTSFITSFRNASVIMSLKYRDVRDFFKLIHALTVIN